MEMRNQKSLTNCLAVLFVFAMTFNGYAQTPKNVTTEIVKANKSFMKAFNKADAKALASNYTSDGKLYPSNSDVIEGQAAIEGFWAAVMNSGIKKAELETVNAEAYGNFAVEEGRYKLYLEGDQLADQGKYIVTWKKQNSKWKLYQDIWNTSNPAAQ